jgi:hypothetical protein
LGRYYFLLPDAFSAAFTNMLVKPFFFALNPQQADTAAHKRKSKT